MNKILHMGQYYSAGKDGLTTGLHGVHEWGVAFETMCRLSSDFLEKVIEWYTKNKDLQNLLKHLGAIRNSDEQRGLTEFI